MDGRQNDEDKYTFLYTTQAVHPTEVSSPLLAIIVSSAHRLPQWVGAIHPMFNRELNKST